MYVYICKKGVSVIMGAVLWNCINEANSYLFKSPGYLLICGDLLISLPDNVPSIVHLSYFSNSAVFITIHISYFI